jgi:TRAP-type uncharacterized transport system substrate-binding protein
LAASGTRLIVDRILAASAADVIKKIIQKPLSINDSVTALERGEIDAFFWSGGVPYRGGLRPGEGPAGAAGRPERGG